MELIYRKALPTGADVIAAVGNGSIWVGGALMKLDGAGNVLRTTTLGANLVASDGSGNLFVLDSSINKLDGNGNLLATYPMPLRASAIAVDAAGAVYVTGKTSGYPFPTTSGAVFLGSEGAFILKLSPNLDRVIFAGLLGGLNPTGIAVDSNGDAYIAGSGVLAPTPQSISFDVTLHGASTFPNDYSQVVITKIDPTGSSLLYAVGLGNGRADHIAVDPTGHAYVLGLAGHAGFQPSLFSVSSAGALMQTSSLPGLLTLNEIPYYSGRVAVRPDGGAVVMGNVRSTRFPIAPNENAPELPILFSFPPDRIDAELSVRVESANPIDIGSWRLDLSVIVRNDGPGDAEDVTLYVPSTFLGVCLPDGIAICSSAIGATAAMIPTLAAGSEARVRFQVSPPIYDLFQPAFSSSVSLSAFTPQAETRDNVVLLTVPFNYGFPMWLATYPGLFYYTRNDVGTTNTLFKSPTTASSVTVTVPSPQRIAGHVWLFDHWGDGSQTNPRTFDTSNAAVTPEIGAMTFAPSAPIFVAPETLDFVTVQGSLPQTAQVEIQPAGTSISVRGGSFLGSVALSRSYGRNGFCLWLIRVTADPTGLPPGTYSSSLRIVVTRPDGTEAPPRWVSGQAIADEVYRGAPRIHRVGPTSTFLVPPQ